MGRAERRGFGRTPVELPVRVRSGDQIVQARVVDLSALGMRYLEPADAPSAPGRKVELQLELPDGMEPLSLEGFVVEERRDGGKRATSVLFAYRSDADSRRLCRHLESTASP
jgi:hypothetical protein